MDTDLVLGDEGLVLDKELVKLAHMRKNGSADTNENVRIEG